MAFIIALILFILTSIVSIKSLNSENKRYITGTKYIFTFAVAAYIVLGLLRFRIITQKDPTIMLFNIWGYFYLFVLLLIFIILYLNFSKWKRHWKSIIAFSTPFIIIILLISIPFMDSQRRIVFELDHSILTKHILPAHVIINVIGELFFFLRFIGSILYLIMEWQLRKKSSMKLIYRLPNLETIENFNKWAISRSLIMLTCGITIGMIMAFINYNTFSLGTAKEMHIYFSWCVILSIFIIRKTMRIASHKVNIMNIVVFLFVMFLFIFTNIFITTGFHSFK